MNPRRIPFALAAALALSGPAPAAGIPETLDAPSYKRLSPNLAVSGRPSPEVLAKLKESGFRTAIDIRQPAEGVAIVREAVEGQGLRFVSVPVSPDTFSVGDVKKIEAVLSDEKAAPVLLFCSSSNRVGGVIAVIAARSGRSRDEALVEGKKAGLKSAAMEKAALRVIEESAKGEAGPGK